MGWALKTAPPRKRFSQRQKDYLVARFKLGESSGKKENAAFVAKAMVRAKDVDVNRLFHAEEFLTSKQIFSFFGRLAAKKSLKRTATLIMSMKRNYLIPMPKARSVKN